MKITKGNFSCTKGQLTIRGTEYRPEGNKLPAVILSHGFNGIGGDLAHYAEQLAGWGFAAYVFDFCGGSSRSTSDGRFQDMTVFTEVQDLAVVAAYVCGLPYINSEDLTLMGCSQGGFVSALFAAAHPEVVVSRLILFYPALCIPEDARRGKMLMYAFDPSNIPEQIFPVIPEGCSDPIEPLGRAYVASVQKIDAFAAIALYPGPVLIVHGDSDTAVNVINSRRAQAAYHSVKPLRCQLAEISGANHGFMGNEDVHAMELVREFIQGGTNVLSVDVVLTGFSREEQGEETVLTIPFGGVIQTPFFSGMIQPGAVDIQRWRGQEIVRLCADYIIKGTDYSIDFVVLCVARKGVETMASKQKVTGNLAVSEQQRVIVIEATEKPQDLKLRVAAYTRVSSDSADQLNSFAAQNRYYTALISSKENWTMVDIYADRGITGTSVEKRDDFQRLISDCRRGLIDRVLCKSISRFARNTTDCLEAIRELKSLGIGITFEKEHIDTAKVSGEMLTALFAAMAQAESESISRNSSLGVQMRMKSGTFNTCKNPFGYRLNGNKLEIYEPEAKLVREIFSQFLNGWSCDEIAEYINGLNIPTRDGNTVWRHSTIKYILQNERYAGNALLQKNYSTDTLPRQKKRNRGERQQYYVAGSNPPIISVETFEAQQTYYTDKIMNNPEWTMAGLFADQGITGTCARKRPEFLRMIRQCRKKKIDIVLTKSISRFARNTVDCLHYIRALRELGIAVIFEKEGINTLESDIEMLITILGAFAQAESESISGNIAWGIRQAMREGRVSYQYSRWYAYQKGADGRPEIIPEQAEVVRRIYDQYIAGASLRQIKDYLEAGGILNVEGAAEWTISSIKGILTNEKYCGDALLQKTFIQDCISKKVIRNTGQLPQYLIQNCHKGIVDRQLYDTVQAEMARRSAGKSPSKKNAPTGRASYASKYALSERLICGECGTLYRRCVWAKNGRKRVVWRCVSRLDYGTKYCHHSPTLDEEPLQRAVLAAINEAMGSRNEMVRQITETMELELAALPGQTVSLSDIQRQIGELEGRFNLLLEQAAEQLGEPSYVEQFQAITNEIAALKMQRGQMEEQRKSNALAVYRLDTAASLLEKASPELIEWDEAVIRQLVDTVKVLSEDGLHSTFQSIGISGKVTANYLRQAGALQLTKTHGRREVAYLNRAWEDVLAFDYALDHSTRKQPLLNRAVNTKLCRCAGDAGLDTPENRLMKILQKPGCVLPDDRI